MMKTFSQMINEEKNPDIGEKLLKFFVENPYPKDSAIHKFAEDNKINPHVLEQEIYALLSTFLSSGRFNMSEKKVDIDPEQLKMGISVEKEHLDATSKYADILSSRITRDHLQELPDYYSRLKKMESAK